MGLRFTYLAWLSIHIMACIWYALPCTNAARSRPLSAGLCMPGTWADLPGKENFSRYVSLLCEDDMCNVKCTIHLLALLGAVAIYSRQSHIPTPKHFHCGIYAGMWTFSEAVGSKSKWLGVGPKCCYSHCAATMSLPAEQQTKYPPIQPCAQHTYACWAWSLVANYSSGHFWPAGPLCTCTVMISLLSIRKSGW